MFPLILALSVICIGDSMTHGNVVATNYCDTSTHETLNTSISATTALGWGGLDREYWEAHGSFQVAHILLGSNDAAWRFPTEDVLAALLRIVDRVDADIVVISLEPLSLGGNAINRNPDLTRYNLAIPELWAIEGIYEGIDWNALPGIQTDEYYRYQETPNGLHPNAATHALARPLTDAAIQKAWDDFTAVPEPSSALLVATALVTLGVVRRREL